MSLMVKDLMDDLEKGNRVVECIKKAREFLTRRQNPVPTVPEWTQVMPLSSSGAQWVHWSDNSTLSDTVSYTTASTATLTAAQLQQQVQQQRREMDRAMAMPREYNDIPTAPGGLLGALGGGF